MQRWPAGALAAIDGSAPDAAKQIMDATGGGARMILDLVGAASTVNWPSRPQRAAPRSSSSVSMAAKSPCRCRCSRMRPLAIRGSYVGNLAELTEIVSLAKTGKLKLVPVKRRPLDEANSALMDLKDGKVIGRVVLVP